MRPTRPFALAFSRRTRRILSILLLACSVTLLLPAFAVAQGPLPGITITDLGNLGGDSVAYAINNEGQVVGYSYTAAFQPHAFLWQNGTMTDLGTLVGGTQSVADDINNEGQVVGYSETAAGEQHAFLWQNGSMTDLGTLGGSSSSARGINDQGQVVGVSSTATNGHAFLWQNGSMTDLGTLGEDGNQAYYYSGAHGINDQGQVVGESGHATLGGYQAVLWTVPQTSQSPREQILALRATVDDLVTAQVLNKGQGQTLLTKLDGALQNLERGNSTAAANQLQAFVNQVKAFHKTAKLTAAQAQPLIDTATSVIDQLRR